MRLGDRGLPGPTDEELDAMENQTELENLGDIREGDSSDLVLCFHRVFRGKLCSRSWDLRLVFYWGLLLVYV